MAAQPPQPRRYRQMDSMGSSSVSNNNNSQMDSIKWWWPQVWSIRTNTVNPHHRYPAVTAKRTATRLGMVCSSSRRSRTTWMAATVKNYCRDAPAVRARSWTRWPNASTVPIICAPIVWQHINSCTVSMGTVSSGSRVWKAIPYRQSAQIMAGISIWWNRRHRKSFIRIISNNSINNNNSNSLNNRIINCLKTISIS